MQPFRFLFVAVAKRFMIVGLGVLNAVNSQATAVKKEEFLLKTLKNPLKPDRGLPRTLKKQQIEWSQWSGLNRRPTVYETVALPLSYIGIRSLTNLENSIKTGRSTSGKRIRNRSK